MGFCSSFVPKIRAMLRYKGTATAMLLYSSVELSVFMLKQSCYLQQNHKQKSLIISKFVDLVALENRDNELNIFKIQN